MTALQKRFQAQLEPVLYKIGIPTLLIALVVKTLDPSSNVYTSLNMEIFQAFKTQQTIGWSWTLMGLLSKEWRWFFSRYNHKSPSCQASPKRCLHQILLTLWETAWDLWRYRNGLVHSTEISLTKESVLKEVEAELQQGTELLSVADHYWISWTMGKLAKKPVSFSKDS